MNKKKLILFLLALLLLIAAGARMIHNKKVAEANTPPAKDYPLVVPVQVAEEKEARLTLPYLAEVQSDSDTTIASRVTARVLMIKPAGTQVRKGEVVAQLDASDLNAKRESLRQKIEEVQSQIQARNAELSALKKTHERNARLLASQAISRDRYETETARIESLQAQINALQANIASLHQNIHELDDTLTYTRVVAPSDAVISKTMVNEGSTATAGHALLTLSGGDLRRLVVRVPHEKHPTHLLWEDQQCELVALNSTFHGLDEYTCAIQTSIPAGNRVEVSLVVFRGRAVVLPHDGVLHSNGKYEVIELDGSVGKARPIRILGEGVEGYAVEGIAAGQSYLVAKPDILLLAKTGVPITATGL